jgi:hypothetical protein
VKSAPCPRLFEAEALRDGRLAGAELASFERHASSCAACTREIRELEALASALRGTPASASDELLARRERTRLLAAFNHELVAPGRSWPRALLLAPVVLALVAVAAFVLVRTPAPPPASPVAGGVTVRGDSGARWSERTEAGKKQLIVERGALWIHVDRPPDAGRFVVVLPDGELEDIGTTFTVAVAEGRTTRVSVEDGRVLLRLRGQAPVSLGAGERWSPTPSPSIADSTTAHSTTPLPPLSAPPSSAPPSPVASPSPPPSSRASTPSSLSSLSSAAPPLARDPSLDFRAAMAALNTGQHREAAALFAGFLAQHPRDPRAEDAAYLRIIAFQRSGDRSAMKDAAHGYLRRYPKGFRRTEAELLAH